MNTRRILLWGLATGWCFLFAAGYIYSWGDIGRNLGMISASAPERAHLESADKAFYDLLSRAPAYEPGQYLLLLSNNDPGQSLFLSYRSAYQLYPVTPLYVPVQFIPPASQKFSLEPGPDMAAMLREKGVTVAAIHAGPDPTRSGYYRITLDRNGKMTLARLPSRPAPPVPPATRPVLWLAGLALAGLFGAGCLFLAGLLKPGGRGIGVASALSLYAGIGITAWLMVVLGVLRVPFSIPLVLAGWAVVLAVAGGYRVFLRHSGPVLPVSPEAPVESMGRLDRAGVVLAILAACWALVAVSIPMSGWGNWDAWAIWNLKAKACWLARGIPFAMLGEPIYQFSHHDYPLGLPMFQSWLSTWAGGMDERLLRLLSPFYLFILFFLCAGLLKELGMARGHWLASAALIAIPKFMQQGYSGYADLPVACGMAAAMYMLARAYRGAPAGWAVGLFGGLSALHKDEGLIWAGVSLLLLAVWARRGRVKWAQVAAAAIILAVLVGPWKATTASLGLKPNDYQVEPAKMVNDAPERIPQVFRAVMLETLGPGVSMPGIAGMGTPPGQWWVQFRGAWFLMWYAILAWAVLGFRSWRREPLLVWLAILPAVQACAYTAVYTASIASSLPWHLTTSLDRLLLQIAPSVFILSVVACFGPVPEAPVHDAGTGKKGQGRARKP